MPLVARASNTVRNKNILIVLMCLGFAVVFAYDGFIGWPRAQDAAVARWKQLFNDGKLVPPEGRGDAWKIAFEKWPGWKNASEFQRQQMDEINAEAKKIPEGAVSWHGPFDMSLQIYIAYGLFAAVLISLWWLIHCQQRRAIADEATVSPAKNISIPWENITIVDNTRWKKSGIVDITYVDAAGQSHQAKFDDYELDREPLLQILDQLAEKARKAEFIPKEDPAPAA